MPSENGLFRSATGGQQSCNERFQRCTGSLDCCVTYWKRGRRCLVTLSTCKRLKIGKQVSVCRAQSAPIRIHSAIQSCNKRFQRRAGCINHCVLSCKRGRRCLVALSACGEHLKISKQVSVSRRYSAAIRMPLAFAMFHCALLVTSWKRQSLRFQLQARATLPCRPLHLETSKDRQTGILFAVGEVLPFASPLHLLRCTERFQQRAGSINCCVFSFERGRRCLVALFACKQLKIGKQVFVCRG